MQQTTLREERTESVLQSGTSFVREKFSLILWGIALAALIPYIIMGLTQFIDYDGYWHVFTATQDRRFMFLAEWMNDAHPPLYYYLLRIVGKWGHSHLLYRSVSIVPGVLSIFVLGQVARKIFRDPRLALLASAAYGFSITIIDISCEVRSYSLALLFIIAAFYFYLDLFIEWSPLRLFASSFAFGLFSTLAIFSEYYSVFFLGTCLILLPFLIWRDPLLLQAWRSRKRTFLIALFLGLILPVLGTRYLYVKHVHNQIVSFGHLGQYYWTAGTPVLEFITRNTINELNFFLPFEIKTQFALIAVLSGLTLLFFFFAFRKRSGTSGALQSVAPLVLLLLWAELLVLSIAGRYPYGGALRQQSILAPFVVLSTFLLVDFLLSRLNSIGKQIGLLVVALLVMANFVYQWKIYPMTSEDPFAARYAKFRATMPKADGVYLDQFSQIAYYSETYTWKWKIQERFPPPERFDEYMTTSPSGEKLAALRKVNENFDLFTIDFYRVLYNSMHVAGLQSVNMFQLPPNVPPMEQATIQKNIETIRTLASQAGLSADPIVYSASEAFVAFRVVK